MKTKKLNYLLVMPRLIQHLGDGYSFPLGIAYISSSMKKAGYNIITLNLNHRQGEVDEIIREEIEACKLPAIATPKNAANNEIPAILFSTNHCPCGGSLKIKLFIC